MLISSTLKHFYDVEGVGFGVGGEEQDFDACGFGFFDGGCEFGVGGCVGADFFYSVHLYHESDGGVEACGFRFYQFTDMLYAAFGGGIGEVANAVKFEGTAFDFQQEFFAAPLHIKIYP